jgi:CRISPR/Cas system CSM-associated protein Csm3 (group 7 of RAMP superfamily)
MTTTLERASDITGRVHDRWEIKGRLVVQSPLRIRTGDTERSDHNTSRDPNAPEIWAIDLDHSDQPFIPGSTLKGLFRTLVLRLSPSRPQVFAIFGDRPMTERLSRDDQTAIGGSADFRNAFVANDRTAPTSKRSSIKVHRGTATAEDGLLRTQRVVDGGAAFDITIILDGVGEEEVALVLAAASLIRGDVVSALGGGTGQGYGRVAWSVEHETIKRLGPAETVAWLKSKTANPWDFARSLSRADDETLAALVTDALNNEVAARSIPLTVDLCFDGYFLVSEAISQEERERTKNTATRRPMTAANHPKKAFLPGSSLRGAMRSQAERIWRTLACDVTSIADAAPPAPIEALFGSTGRAGALRFDDFHGVGEAILAKHDMVAIDRFTGGAAEALKFAIDVFVSPRLQGEIQIVLDQNIDHSLSGKDIPANSITAVDDAAFGLLALLIRDLAEGDVPLGFGTRKGYGAVSSIQINAQAALSGLEEALKIAKCDPTFSLDHCVKALRASLAKPDRKR